MSTTTELQEEVNVDKMGHLTFSEQREVTKDDPMVFGTNPPIYRLDPLSMPETTFTSEDILRNPVLIKSFSWKFTHAPLTNLAGFSVPGIVASTASFHQLMLKTYAYYRPQFTVRVQVNSTKFHQGRLAAWYDPFNQHGKSDLSSQKITTRTSITGLPHSMIDAAMSNVVEFQIPFEHIQTALTTNSDDTLNEMGRYNITVFNKLNGAVGTSSEVTVNVYLAASIIKLHVPIHPHTANVQSTFELQGFLGDLLGQGTGMLENGSNAVWNLLTGNYSGAANNGAKALGQASNLLRTFNLDKPTNPLNAVENMISRPAPLAHCNGVDSSVRLGNSPMGGYLCHTEFSSTTEAEMSIQNLLKIPMFVKNLEWKSSQAPNTVLLSIPITPSYCDASNVGASKQVTTADGNYTISTKYYAMFNTYLSYISSLFLYWRGPIKIRADVVSTQFHTGRLGFQFVPNNDQTDPSTWTLSDRSNDPLTVFDIHEMKSIEVETPFFSSTMSKLWVPLTTVYSKGTNDWVNDNNIIGYVHIYVLNKLSAPTNVADSVEINLYMSAGENFELDVLAPRPNIGATSDLYPTPIDLPLKTKNLPQPYTVPKFEMQMDSQAVPTRSEQPQVKTTLTKGPDPVKPYNRFGDQLKDVREIGRRYVKAGVAWMMVNRVEDRDSRTLGYVDPAHIEATINIPVTPFVGLHNDRQTLNGKELNVSDLSYNDYQVCSAAIARLYATWHGSMRYKIIPLDGRKLPGIFEANYIPDNNSWTPLEKKFPENYQSTPDVGAFWNWSSYPSVITLNSQNGGLEVEVPYYSPYQQLVTEGNNGGKLENFISGYLRIKYTASSFDGVVTKYIKDGLKPAALYPVIGFQLYQALGDDFSFGFPVSPPRTYYFYEVKSTKNVSVDQEESAQGAGGGTE